MIVTKQALPRRTFLRGAGITLALPLLDAMVPALTALAKTAARPTRRLGFLYVPNGVAMTSTVNYWTPAGEGSQFEWSPILKPLEPFRRQLVVVSGLSQRQADAKGDGNGDHTRGSATWLSGVRPKLTEGADVAAGVTVDQIAAGVLGADTLLPSIELGLDPNFRVGNCENGYSCVYMNTLSWRTPTTPLPAEINPRAVFEQLFGEGGTPAERTARMRRNRSILDEVAGQMRALQKTLGPSDRATVDDYVESVREIERRLDRAERSDAGSGLPPLDRPMGVPDRFDEHVRVMFDLLSLAFRGDITRVFTFMMGRETSPRTFSEIGIAEPHHGLSHHGNRLEQIEKFSKVNTYQVQQFGQFLEKLQATPDGDGSLLDHSLLLYGGGLSNGNEHSHINLPLVLAGGAAGRLTGGRHARFAVDTPMSNLLLAMLDKVDVPADRLGDSTGRLGLEPLPGV
ncbi:MAG: hypothetical protein DMF90_04325 [Acidobacteria bacterium]|nr:MAG: hypothetical protein DMF90_04325 [Acidobacteriota bacterium]